jgi:hypothetical protein
MPPRRRWSMFPQRIKEELNSIAGVAGVGGAALGVAGVILTNPIAPVLVGLGILFCGPAFGYAIYKAIPPILRRPEDLVGQTVTLLELDNILPRIIRLSIVGRSMAGKTTLKDRLAFSLSQGTRTQEMTAYITALQTTPLTFIAVLDGGGEKFSQQFKLAGICDCLCVILDHNASNTDQSIDKQRLIDHETFLQQIRHDLDQNYPEKKRWVQFLINKHDLWSKNSEVERLEFEKLCADEVLRWKQGNRAQVIEVSNHSNDNPSDVSRFVDILKRMAQS